MTKSKYLLNIDDLKTISINHGTDMKKLFIFNEDTDTLLTQFAWSKLKPIDYCDSHTHQTMDEYFFVQNGNGTHEIGDEVLELKSGDFIRIPAGTTHRLKIKGHHKLLELVYFGIATD